MLIFLRFTLESTFPRVPRVLQIRATDHGEPQRNHQTRVSVQVVETPKKSEHPPVFKTNNQSVEVTESDEVGFLVALVQATDKDGDSLWYDILGKNTCASCSRRFHDSGKSHARGKGNLCPCN